MDLICNLITLYILVVLGRIILQIAVQFGRLGFDHPVRKVEQALGKVVDPVLRPIRSIVPGLPAGGMQLDLSPLVLILGLRILQSIIC
ncbi:MAG: YggT family protein [Acidimicrobiia bacterium]